MSHCDKREEKLNVDSEDLAGENNNLEFEDNNVQFIPVQLHNENSRSKYSRKTPHPDRDRRYSHAELRAIQRFNNLFNKVMVLPSSTIFDRNKHIGQFRCHGTSLSSRDLPSLAHSTIPEEKICEGYNSKFIQNTVDESTRPDFQQQIMPENSRNEAEVTGTHLIRNFRKKKEPKQLNINHSKLNNKTLYLSTIERWIRKFRTNEIFGKIEKNVELKLYEESQETSQNILNILPIGKYTENASEYLTDVNLIVVLSSISNEIKKNSYCNFELSIMNEIDEKRSEQFDIVAEGNESIQLTKSGRKRNDHHVLRSAIKIKHDALNMRRTEMSENKKNYSFSTALTENESYRKSKAKNSKERKKTYHTHNSMLSSGCSQVRKTCEAYSKQFRIFTSKLKCDSIMPCDQKSKRCELFSNLAYESDQKKRRRIVDRIRKINNHPCTYLSHVCVLFQYQSENSNFSSNASNARSPGYWQSSNDFSERSKSEESKTNVHNLKITNSSTSEFSERTIKEPMEMNRTSENFISERNILLQNESANSSGMIKRASAEPKRCTALIAEIERILTFFELSRREADICLCKNKIILRLPYPEMKIERETKIQNLMKKIKIANFCNNLKKSKNSSDEITYRAPELKNLKGFGRRLLCSRSDFSRKSEKCIDIVQIKRECDKCTEAYGLHEREDEDEKKLIFEREYIEKKAVRTQREEKIKSLVKTIKSKQICICKKMKNTSEQGSITYEKKLSDNNELSTSTSNISYSSLKRIRSKTSSKKVSFSDWPSEMVAAKEEDIDEPNMSGISSDDIPPRQREKYERIQQTGCEISSEFTQIQNDVKLNDDTYSTVSDKNAMRDNISSQSDTILQTDLDVVNNGSDSLSDEKQESLNAFIQIRQDNDMKELSSSEHEDSIISPELSQSYDNVQLKSREKIRESSENATTIRQEGTEEMNEPKEQFPQKNIETAKKKDVGIRDLTFETEKISIPSEKNQNEDQHEISLENMSDYTKRISSERSKTELDNLIDSKFTRDDSVPELSLILNNQNVQEKLSTPRYDTAMDITKEGVTEQRKQTIPYEDSRFDNEVKKDNLITVEQPSEEIFHDPSPGQEEYDDLAQNETERPKSSDIRISKGKPKNIDLTIEKFDRKLIDQYDEERKSDQQLQVEIPNERTHTHDSEMNQLSEDKRKGPAPIRNTRPFKGRIEDEQKPETFDNEEKKYDIDHIIENRTLDGRRVTKKYDKIGPKNQSTGTIVQRKVTGSKIAEKNEKENAKSAEKEPMKDMQKGKDIKNINAMEPSPSNKQRDHQVKEKTLEKMSRKDSLTQATDESDIRSPKLRTNTKETFKKQINRTQTIDTSNEKHKSEGLHSSKQPEMKHSQNKKLVNQLPQQMGNIVSFEEEPYRNAKTERKKNFEEQKDDKKMINKKGPEKIENKTEKFQLGTKNTSGRQNQKQNEQLPQPYFKFGKEKTTRTSKELAVRGQPQKVKMVKTDKNMISDKETKYEPTNNQKIAAEKKNIKHFNKKTTLGRKTTREMLRDVHEELGKREIILKDDETIDDKELTLKSSQLRHDGIDKKNIYDETNIPKESYLKEKHSDRKFSMKTQTETQYVEGIDGGTEMHRTEVQKEEMSSKHIPSEKKNLNQRNVEPNEELVKTISSKNDMPSISGKLPQNMVQRENTIGETRTKLQESKTKLREIEDPLIEKSIDQFDEKQTINEVGSFYSSCESFDSMFSLGHLLNGEETECKSGEERSLVRKEKDVEEKEPEILYEKSDIRKDEIPQISSKISDTRKPGRNAYGRGHDLSDNGNRLKENSQKTRNLIDNKDRSELDPYDAIRVTAIERNPQAQTAYESKVPEIQEQTKLRQEIDAPERYLLKKHDSGMSLSIAEKENNEHKTARTKMSKPKADTTQEKTNISMTQFELGREKNYADEISNTQKILSEEKSIRLSEKFQPEKIISVEHNLSQQELKSFNDKNNHTLEDERKQGSHEEKKTQSHAASKQPQYSLSTNQDGPQEYKKNQHIADIASFQNATAKPHKILRSRSDTTGGYSEGKSSMVLVKRNLLEEDATKNKSERMGPSKVSTRNIERNLTNEQGELERKESKQSKKKPSITLEEQYSPNTNAIEPTEYSKVQQIGDKTSLQKATVKSNGIYRSHSDIPEGYSLGKEARRGSLDGEARTRGFLEKSETNVSKMNSTKTNEQNQIERKDSKPLKAQLSNTDDQRVHPHEKKNAETHFASTQQQYSPYPRNIARQDQEKKQQIVDKISLQNRPSTPHEIYKAPADIPEGQSQNKKAIPLVVRDSLDGNIPTRGSLSKSQSKVSKRSRGKLQKNEQKRIEMKESKPLEAQDKQKLHSQTKPRILSTQQQYSRYTKQMKPHEYTGNLKIPNKISKQDGTAPPHKINKSHSDIPKRYPQERKARTLVERSLLKENEQKEIDKKEAETKTQLRLTKLQNEHEVSPELLLSDSSARNPQSEADVHMEQKSTKTNLGASSNTTRISDTSISIGKLQYKAEMRELNELTKYVEKTKPPENNGPAKSNETSVKKSGQSSKTEDSGRNYSFHKRFSIKEASVIEQIQQRHKAKGMETHTDLMDKQSLSKRIKSNMGINKLNSLISANNFGTVSPDDKIKSGKPKESDINFDRRRIPKEKLDYSTSLEKMKMVNADAPRRQPSKDSGDLQIAKISVEKNNSAPTFSIKKIGSPVLLIKKHSEDRIPRTRTSSTKVEEDETTLKLTRSEKMRTPDANHSEEILFRKETHPLPGNNLIEQNVPAKSGISRRESKSSVENHSLEANQTPVFYRKKEGEALAASEYCPCSSDAGRKGNLKHSLNQDNFDSNISQRKLIGRGIKANVEGRTFEGDTIAKYSVQTKDQKFITKCQLRPRNSRTECRDWPLCDNALESRISRHHIYMKTEISKNLDGQKARGEYREKGQVIRDIDFSTKRSNSEVNYSDNKLLKEQDGHTSIDHACDCMRLPDGDMSKESEVKRSKLDRLGLKKDALLTKYSSTSLTKQQFSKLKFGDELRKIEKSTEYSSFTPTESDFSYKFSLKRKQGTDKLNITKNGIGRDEKISDYSDKMSNRKYGVGARRREELNSGLFVTENEKELNLRTRYRGTRDSRILNSEIRHAAEKFLDVLLEEAISADRVRRKLDSSSFIDESKPSCKEGGEEVDFTEKIEQKPLKHFIDERQRHINIKISISTNKLKLKPSGNGKQIGHKLEGMYPRTEGKSKYLDILQDVALEKASELDVFLGIELKTKSPKICNKGREKNICTGNMSKLNGLTRVETEEHEWSPSSLVRIKDSADNRKLKNVLQEHAVPSTSRNLRTTNKEFSDRKRIDKNEYLYVPSTKKQYTDQKYKTFPSGVSASSKTATKFKRNDQRYIKHAENKRAITEFERKVNDLRKCTCSLKCPKEKHVGMDCNLSLSSHKIMDNTSSTREISSLQKPRNISNTCPLENNEISQKVINQTLSNVLYRTLTKTTSTVSGIFLSACDLTHNDSLKIGSCWREDFSELEKCPSNGESSKNFIIPEKRVIFKKISKTIKFDNDCCRRSKSLEPFLSKHIITDEYHKSSRNHISSVEMGCEFKSNTHHKISSEQSDMKFSYPCALKRVPSFKNLCCSEEYENSCKENLIHPLKYGTYSMKFEEIKLPLSEDTENKIFSSTEINEHQCISCEEGKNVIEKQDYVRRACKKDKSPSKLQIITSNRECEMTNDEEQITIQCCKKNYQQDTPQAGTGILNNSLMKLPMFQDQTNCSCERNSIPNGPQNETNELVFYRVYNLLNSLYSYENGGSLFNNKTSNTSGNYVKEECMPHFSSTESNTQYSRHTKIQRNVSRVLGRRDSGILVSPSTEKEMRVSVRECSMKNLFTSSVQKIFQRDNEILYESAMQNLPMNHEKGKKNKNASSPTRIFIKSEVEYLLHKELEMITYPLVEFQSYLTGLNIVLSRSSRMLQSQEKHLRENRSCNIIQQIDASMLHSFPVSDNKLESFFKTKTSASRFAQYNRHKFVVTPYREANENVECSDIPLSRIEENEASLGRTHNKLRAVSSSMIYHDFICEFTQSEQEFLINKKYEFDYDLSVVQKTYYEELQCNFGCNSLFQYQVCEDDSFGYDSSEESILSRKIEKYNDSLNYRDDRHFIGSNKLPNINFIQYSTSRRCIYKSSSRLGLSSKIPCEPLCPNGEDSRGQFFKTSKLCENCSSYISTPHELIESDYNLYHNSKINQNESLSRLNPPTEYPTLDESIHMNRSNSRTFLSRRELTPSDRSSSELSIPNDANKRDTKILQYNTDAVLYHVSVEVDKRQDEELKNRKEKTKSKIGFFQKTSAKKIIDWFKNIGNYVVIKKKEKEDPLLMAEANLIKQKKILSSKLRHPKLTTSKLYLHQKQYERRQEITEKSKYLEVKPEPVLLKIGSSEVIEPLYSTESNEEDESASIEFEDERIKEKKLVLSEDTFVLFARKKVYDRLQKFGKLYYTIHIDERNSVDHVSIRSAESVEHKIECEDRPFFATYDLGANDVRVHVRKDNFEDKKREGIFKDKNYVQCQNSQVKLSLMRGKRYVDDLDPTKAKIIEIDCTNQFSEIKICYKKVEHSQPCLCEYPKVCKTVQLESSELSSLCIENQDEAIDTHGLCAECKECKEKPELCKDYERCVEHKICAAKNMYTDMKRNNEYEMDVQNIQILYVSPKAKYLAKDFEKTSETFSEMLEKCIFLSHPSYDEFTDNIVQHQQKKLLGEDQNHQNEPQTLILTITRFESILDVHDFDVHFPGKKLKNESRYTNQRDHNWMKNSSKKLEKYK